MQHLFKTHLKREGERSPASGLLGEEREGSGELRKATKTGRRSSEWKGTGVQGRPLTPDALRRRKEGKRVGQGTVIWKIRKQSKD